MNNRGYSSTPRNSSPYNQNVGSVGSTQLWGSPATGFLNRSPQSWGSPSIIHYQRPNYSPRNQVSPRKHFDNTRSSYCRVSSPKEHSSNNFRTPNSQYLPFSKSPANGNFSGKGCFRKSFDRSFQNPRQGNSCNPGGSQNIEDYYHPDILQDPWKFCTPVPVTHSPS